MFVEMKKNSLLVNTLNTVWILSLPYFRGTKSWGIDVKATKLYLIQEIICKKFDFTDWSLYRNTKKRIECKLRSFLFSFRNMYHDGLTISLHRLKNGIVWHNFLHLSWFCNLLEYQAGLKSTEFCLFMHTFYILHYI